jgi:hypothetical protein
LNIPSSVQADPGVSEPVVVGGVEAGVVVAAAGGGVVVEEGVAAGVGTTRAVLRLVTTVAALVPVAANTPASVAEVGVGACAVTEGAAAVVVGTATGDTEESPPLTGVPFSSAMVF